MIRVRPERRQIGGDRAHSIQSNGDNLSHQLDRVIGNTLSFTAYETGSHWHDGHMRAMVSVTFWKEHLVFLLEICLWMFKGVSVGAWGSQILHQSNESWIWGDYGQRNEEW